MTLKNLARIGRLKSHAPTREEIRKLLAGAARGLKDAGNAANSNATKLTLAYTAIMEAAQAALFANGYRPSKSEGWHHMTMVQSLVHTIGIEPPRMRVLDTIRHKRNVVDYSGGDVEPSDAREAMAGQGIACRRKGVAGEELFGVVMNAGSREIASASCMFARKPSASRRGCSGLQHLSSRQGRRFDPRSRPAMCDIMCSVSRRLSPWLPISPSTTR